MGRSEHEKDLRFNAILCELGLSGFPEWQKIIENLVALLKPNGKLVIMDWYIDRPSLRGKFINRCAATGFYIDHSTHGCTGTGKAAK